MVTSVTLQDITIDNFERFIDMELPEHQRDYLDSNAVSIAQSKYYEDFVMRGIYCDGEPAGFLLYDISAESVPGLYGIYRFMVDFPKQGKGIGRKAMALLLDELHSKPDVHRIIIYYKPGNAVAQAFYRSFGFRECGIDDSGEMIAEIIPSRLPHQKI